MLSTEPAPTTSLPPESTWKARFWALPNMVWAELKPSVLKPMASVGRPKSSVPSWQMAESRRADSGAPARASPLRMLPTIGSMKKATGCPGRMAWMAVMVPNSSASVWARAPASVAGAVMPTMAMTAMSSGRPYSQQRMSWAQLSGSR